MDDADRAQKDQDWFMSLWENQRTNKPDTFSPICRRCGIELEAHRCDSGTCIPCQERIEHDERLHR